MTRTTYVCKGCAAELRSRRDLRGEEGTARTRWQCRYCQTTVPAVVAEKIKHQPQHSPRRERR